MDILDRLEQRVLALLEQANALRAENATLKKEVFALREGSLAETQILEKALEREREARTTAIARIDALLQCLEEDPACGGLGAEQAGESKPGAE